MWFSVTMCDGIDGDGCEENKSSWTLRSKICEAGELSTGPGVDGACLPKLRRPKSSDTGVIGGIVEGLKALPSPSVTSCAVFAWVVCSNLDGRCVCFSEDRAVALESSDAASILGTVRQGVPAKEVWFHSRSPISSLDQVMTGFAEQ